VLEKAKAAFVLDLDDLYRRGARLIRECVECGVTSTRAHVEVDPIDSLEVAEALRDKFKMIYQVQIAGKDFTL
jgi:cytosine/adenosine deaminase-related metal-dependent hydrolase